MAATKQDEQLKATLCGFEGHNGVWPKGDMLAIQLRAQLIDPLGNVVR